MVSNLWHSATTSFSPSGLAGTPYELGQNFEVLIAGDLTHIAWYRQATGAGNAPNVLRVWDRTTQSVVYQAATVPDNGAVGWQTHTLPAPVGLVSGTVYTLSAGWPSGGNAQIPSTTGVTATAPDFPIQRSASKGSSALTNAYPASLDNALYVMDLTFDPTGSADPVEGAASVSDVQNRLTDWLDTVEGGQANSAPLATYAAITDAGSGLAAIKGALDDNVAAELADAGHGLSAIKTAETGLDAKVGSASGLDFATLFAGLAGLWTRTATLLGDSATLVARVPSTIGDSFAYLIGQSTGTEGSAVGALSGRSGFPTELWTMADEVEFVQAKSWDVPADLYTLSTSDWPVTIRQVLVDGAPWRPRLGWWAVRNGDLFGARRFVDWEASILEDGGRRMSGIVVWLEPNTAGTLQAWRLT